MFFVRSQYSPAEYAYNLVVYPVGYGTLGVPWNRENFRVESLFREIVSILDP